MRKQWGTFLLCLACSCSLAWATPKKTEELPAFVARGTFLQKQYLNGAPDPVVVTEARFTFYHSNNWWKIEVRDLLADIRNNPSTRKEVPINENCMKIPDGIRLYGFKTGTTNATTFLCPFSFPPPAKVELLLPWLTFCPQPDLPLIEEGKMRRFISVPSCQTDALMHPDNEGTFALTHLNPNKWFLSTLNVSNNGVSIFLDIVNGAPETRTSKYKAPLDKGFLEFSFSVLASTNIDGVQFPLRTELKSIAPSLSKVGVLTTNSIAELVTEKIERSITEARNSGYP